MKKIIVFALVILSIVMLYASNVFATDEILNSSTTSSLIQISEEQKKDLQGFIDLYDGSETYGFTAFVLDKIRIFSIPFCFLGIVISAVYQYV